jgi:hypothetical protein
MEKANPEKDLRLPFFGSFLGIQKRTEELQNFEETTIQTCLEVAWDPSRSSG